MRLVTDHSLAAGCVDVCCLVCGRRHRLADSTIDRDGPSFRAYYCPEHKPEGTPAPCQVYGCQRPHLHGQQRQEDVR